MIVILRNGSVFIDFEVHLSFLLGRDDDVSIVEEEAKEGIQDAVTAGIQDGRLSNFAIEPESFAISGGNYIFIFRVSEIQCIQDPNRTDVKCKYEKEANVHHSFNMQSA